MGCYDRKNFYSPQLLEKASPAWASVIISLISIKLEGRDLGQSSHPGLRPRRPRWRFSVPRSSTRRSSRHPEVRPVKVKAKSQNGMRHFGSLQCYRKVTPHSRLNTLLETFTEMHSARSGITLYDVSVQTSYNIITHFNNP